MSEVRRLGGRYQVGELLGRGGMAVVHEGRDERLGRRVAIKILRQDLASDPVFLARFEREAQSAASLNHPNIVAVYDTGEDTDGDETAVPYIVMELVEGITLKELLQSGNPLVPERALGITSDILAALDYSHRHGIIHRDIKPGNVMLTSTGTVKVMDFGIARAVTASGQTATSTSTVLGTAAYLSPEQARGETVDARSDLYSTGVVLYELLTRRAPFVADTAVAVAFAHVNEPLTPPSQIDPSVTPELDLLVTRAMAKDPAERYQTAAEFRVDVERAIAGVPVTRVFAAPVDPTGPGDDDETVAVAAGAIAATGAMEPLVGPSPGRPSAAQDTGKRGSTARRMALGALIAAVAVAALWLGVRLLGAGAPATVSVPSLEGLTVAEAETTLAAAQLAIGRPEFIASQVPKDSIVSQDPRSGELVDEGSLIDIVISAGPEQTQVPDLIDFRSVSSVRRALSDAGLRLGVVTPVDSEEPEETVLRQEPEAYDSIEVGSTVDVWVSNARVKVPNVVGRSNSQARSALFDKGFEVVYGPRRATTQYAPGTVVAQSPGGGRKAKKGSLVTLVLAEAPPPTPTPTPSPTPTPTPTPTPSGTPAPSASSS